MKIIVKKLYKDKAAGKRIPEGYIWQDVPESRALELIKAGVAVELREMTAEQTLGENNTSHELFNAEISKLNETLAAEKQKYADVKKEFTAAKTIIKKYEKKYGLEPTDPEPAQDIEQDGEPSEPAQAEPEEQ